MLLKLVELVMLVCLPVAMLVLSQQLQNTCFVCLTAWESTSYVYSCWGDVHIKIMRANML